MSLEVNFFSVSPGTIFLGRKTVVTVQYRLGIIPKSDVEVSFSSNGGFTIIGKSSFVHSAGAAKTFTQQLTLTGISPGALAVLTLTAKGGDVTKQDFQNISIGGSDALPLLAKANVEISAFSALEDAGVKRRFVRRLLKENGFQFNRSTKKWSKS